MYVQDIRTNQPKETSNAERIKQALPGAFFQITDGGVQATWVKGDWLVTYGEGKFINLRSQDHATYQYIEMHSIQLREPIKGEEVLTIRF